jgi:hypothetical protein
VDAGQRDIEHTKCYSLQTKIQTRKMTMKSIKKKMKEIKGRRPVLLW